MVERVCIWFLGLYGMNDGTSQAGLTCPYTGTRIALTTWCHRFFKFLLFQKLHFFNIIMWLQKGKGKTSEWRENLLLESWAFLFAKQYVTEYSWRWFLRWLVCGYKSISSVHLAAAQRAALWGKGSGFCPRGFHQLPYGRLTSIWVLELNSQDIKANKDLTQKYIYHTVISWNFSLII